MATAAECVGLCLPPLIPPKPVSQLCEGFYGLAHPAQPAFVSLPLPDIWQCVKASWKELLKELKVWGHTEEEALAVLPIPHSAGLVACRKPQPTLGQDRDTL